jgi:adenylate cyclase
LTDELVQRRLAAILAADVAGYSRLISADEAGALAQLGRLRRDIIEPNIARHSGRLFKIMGDGFLAEFASAVQATSCALAIQRETEAASSGFDDAKKMRLRIGIHVGDVIVEGDDLMGDGVNIAARLESIAAAGGISISRAVHDQVRDRIEIAFGDKGEVALKNIARPVQVFAVGGAKSAEPVKTTAPALALPDKPSIAVMPFQNMSGDPAQEYFADGMVEDIITALSRMKSFFIIARNSTFALKGKVFDSRQIGRELGVRYLLEGSIRKAGNKIRMTTQLVEAESSRHVWSGRFDGELSELFDLQDRITEAVAGAIEPTIRSAETLKVKSKPTESLSAYDHYLLALEQSYLWTRSSFEAAQQHLEFAVSLDPSFSLAKATGSLIIMRKKMQSLARDPDVALGIKWAREALSSHNDDPNTLRSAGQPIAVLARDFELGLFAVRRAVEVCPSSASALSSSGWVHAYVGEKETAVDHFLKAIRQSPLDPEKGSFLSGLALAHFIARDYDGAIEWALKAVPEFFLSSVPVRMAVVALAQAGRIVEAQEFAKRLLEISPDFRVGNAAIPARDVDARDRFISGLRLAGLPE